MRILLMLKMETRTSSSAVMSRKGAVSSDQAVATDIGLDILKMGGNAADAAVATFAAVSVVQPMSCGIGGDCQCLFYRKSDKTIKAINGSGRNGSNATLDKVLAAGITDTNQPEYQSHGLWVTVPGCIAGMFNVIKHFGSGKLSMAEILAPAIKLAEKGVPMPPKSSMMWKANEDKLKNSRNAKDLLNGHKIPASGEMLYNPKLAKCLREIGELGPEVFYNGKIANNIVEEVTHAGGSLNLEDMKECLASSSTSPPIDALSVDFHGFRIWGMKPNTMGIVTLVGLNVLNLFDLKNLEHNSAQYIHIVSETIKYAYLECWNYLCDPDYCLGPLDELLSAATANKIQNAICSESLLKSDASISTGSNTSYTAVVDEEGNGCSFIFSVSSRFGSGLIPDDCGFPLHDRGKCMSLEKESPNAYGPGKLPLHTIIPALITDPSTGDLLGVFGVMGRWMQPQGQIQVLLNMVVFGMDPQVALNQPRFFIGNPSTFMEYIDSYDMLFLEEGISPTVVPLLQKKGHKDCKFVSDATGATFGRGHVVARPVLWNRTAKDQTIWWAGADPRSDGHAVGL